VEADELKIKRGENIASQGGWSNTLRTFHTSTKTQKSLHIEAQNRKKPEPRVSSPWGADELKIERGAPQRNNLRMRRQWPMSLKMGKTCEGREIGTLRDGGGSALGDGDEERTREGRAR
jgi:hypothetical protein